MRRCLSNVLIGLFLAFQSIEAFALCKDQFLALEKSNKSEFQSMQGRLTALANSHAKSCEFFREEALPMMRRHINGYMDLITCYYGALLAANELTGLNTAMRKEAANQCTIAAAGK
jgi:hypothetical protein